MQGPPSELRRCRGLNNRASGDLGEDIASRYLTQRGYAVIERNYRTRRGELDLIARQEDTLVVVEVKLRRGTAYGDPLEAVTPAKQHTIRLLTEEYLFERDPDFQELRFDVVGILLRAGRPEISHVEGAF